MEDIVVFPFEFRDYKCSINQTGRPKYRKLEDLLQQPMTVASFGTPQGDQVDTTIRNSLRTSSLFDFDVLPELITEKLKNLVVAQKKEYVSWKACQSYQVLVYEPGGFFKEHRDKIVNRNHYATLLLFPPAVGICSHLGGDLLITKKNGEKFLFESSKNLQWTILAFDPTLLHEILPVTSGKRVVLKTDLCFSKNIQHQPENNGREFEIMDGSFRHFHQREEEPEYPEIPFTD